MEATLETSKSEMESEREKAASDKANMERSLVETEALMEELRETVRQKGAELDRLGGTKKDLDFQRRYVTCGVCGRLG